MFKRGVEIRFWVLTLTLTLFSSISCATSYLHTHFEKLKSHPRELYHFLKAMPKGGELHYHLMGGAYPEVMLSLAHEGDYCLDKKTFQMSQAKATCTGLKFQTLTPKSDWYQKTLEAWSMTHFKPGKESGHDHFFAAFYKFHDPFMSYEGRLLAAVIKRAAEQHEHYLELMLPIAYMPEGRWTQEVLTVKEMAARREHLLQDHRFKISVEKTVHAMHRLKEEARRELGCEAHPEQPACQIIVRFQYHALREQPFPMMFAQTLQGFLAASRSEDIVAVNLVQAEDSARALQDYQKQMAAFGFLHHYYPTVHIALHAGELASEVPLQDKQSHIHDAIYTGFAERIGHGVNIESEAHQDALLHHMAEIPIPIEVSLTSNEYVLNVSGKRHPLHHYVKYHVPIILSTDDEGIFRTSLTREYMKAAQLYGMSYEALKQISRNALTYSFLSGQSLWADAATAKPVALCTQLDSQACLAFIAHHPKAKIQWDLEHDFLVFEAGVKQLAQNS